MKRTEFLKTAGVGLSTLPFISLFAATNRTVNNSDTKPKIMAKGAGKKLNVIGDKMTLKLTGKETGGQYVLIEQNNEPGVGIPMHIHENEDEIFRVIEGQLEVQVADQKAVIGPGELVYCPRGIPHTWRVVGDSNAIVDLSFFPAGLEEMFEELAKLPPGPPDMSIVSEITGRYGVRFV